jgi:16S rRNA (cytosine967-C5)-methyltransferase
LKKQKNPPGLALRLLAAERLSEVLRGANFAPFSHAEIPDGRDRALANRLVTTALRRHGQINLMIARYLDRGIPKKSGKFEAILRLSLTHLVFLPELGDHSAIFLAVEACKRDNASQHLAKLMNAVLRRAQGEAHQLRHLPHQALFPDTLGPLWRDTYGEDAIEDFAEALLEGAPLDITLRDEDPALIEALNAQPILSDTVRVVSRDRTVEALPGYAEGRWWVQDAAAAIPARLIKLKPGAKVLDLCAAPGGKTAQLIKAGYAVTALDSDAERMARLGENLSRLGYSADLVVADALEWEPAEKFDAVLLDAPCSATGTFRRHPEVVWHRSVADIAGRAAIQKGEEHLRWLADRDDVIVDKVLPAELAGLTDAITPNGSVRTRPGLVVGADVPADKPGTLDGFFIARLIRR